MNAVGGGTDGQLELDLAREGKQRRMMMLSMIVLAISLTLFIIAIVLFVSAGDKDDSSPATSGIDTVRTFYSSVDAKKLDLVRAMLASQYSAYFGPGCSHVGGATRCNTCSSSLLTTSEFIKFLEGFPPKAEVIEREFAIAGDVVTNHYAARSVSGSAESHGVAVHVLNRAHTKVVESYWYQHVGTTAAKLPSGGSIEVPTITPTEVPTLAGSNSSNTLTPTEVPTAQPSMTPTFATPQPSEQPLKMQGSPPGSLPPFCPGVQEVRSLNSTCKVSRDGELNILVVSDIHDALDNLDLVVQSVKNDSAWLKDIDVVIVPGDIGDVPTKHKSKYQPKYDRYGTDKNLWSADLMEDDIFKWNISIARALDSLASIKGAECLFYIGGNHDTPFMFDLSRTLISFFVQSAYQQYLSNLAKLQQLLDQMCPCVLSRPARTNMTVASASCPEVCCATKNESGQ